MKKILIIILACSLVLILVVCSSNEIKEEEKYTMNASYSYGGKDSDKTKITYEVVISGKEKDIEEIDIVKLIINKDYLDLLIENEPNSSEKELGKSPYFKIMGEIIFNTKGKSKQEIDKMKLLEGVKVIDENKNEVIIKFNKEWYF